MFGSSKSEESIEKEKKKLEEFGISLKNYEKVYKMVDKEVNL